MKGWGFFLLALFALAVASSTNSQVPLAFIPADEPLL